MSSACSQRVCTDSQGRKLHSLAADAHEPLWQRGRGHNDMDEEAVLIWAADFLEQLDIASAPGTPKFRLNPAA